MKKIKFILLVEKKEWSENDKKGNSSTSRKKFHPNVVAVLFVTVLTCCC